MRYNTAKRCAFSGRLRLFPLMERHDYETVIVGYLQLYRRLIRRPHTVLMCMYWRDVGKSNRAAFGFQPQDRDRSNDSGAPDRHGNLHPLGHIHRNRDGYADADGYTNVDGYAN